MGRKRVLPPEDRPECQDLSVGKRGRGDQEPSKVGRPVVVAEPRPEGEPPAEPKGSAENSSSERAGRVRTRRLNRNTL